MPSKSVVRPPHLLAASLLALSLSACASIPKDDITAPINIKDLAFEQTLGGATGVWPKSAWWHEFQDPQLDAIIDEALASNPSLKVMDARVEKAVALQNQVNGALYPSADLQGYATATKQSYNNGFPAAFVPHGYLTASKLTINGNYSLDLWGKSKAARKNTRQLAQAQAIDAQAERLTLSANIAKAYVELDRLYKELDIITKVHKGAVKKLDLIRSRVTNHLEPADRALAAEQEETQVAQRLYALEGAIRLQKNLLAALMGKGPDRGLNITRPNLSGAPISDLPSDIGLNLLARRPDIAAARLRVEATSEGFTYAKADYYPNVNLNVFWGVQSLGLDNLFKSGSDVGGIGPAVSLPLFKGGQLRANYDSYKADYDQAVAAYDATLVGAVQDVANSGARMQTTLSQLSNARMRAESARQGFELTKQRRAQGIINDIDYLTADVHYLSTVLDLYDIEAMSLVDHINLITALGGGYTFSDQE